VNNSSAAGGSIFQVPTFEYFVKQNKYKEKKKKKNKIQKLL
jgi:hypothetical protein